MHSLNFWKITYILLITFFGILLVLQKSVDIYWDQTYHKLSPFHVDNKKFKLIQKNTDYSYEKLEAAKEKIYQWNQIVQNEINQKLFAQKRVRQNNSRDLSSQNQADKKLLKPVEVDAEKKKNNSTQSAVQSTQHQILELAEQIKSAYMNLWQKKQDYFSDKIIIRPDETVFFAGDSLMQGVAPHAMRILHKSYHVNSLDLSKQSTGLSYPKAFDWPAEIETILNNDDSIKVLAVFLGPNDPWNFLIHGNKNYSKFKSKEWEDEYSSRIERILIAAKNHFVKVIWLGVPCMKKRKLDQDMIYLNSIYQSEVEKLNQRYLSTADLFRCENGFSDTILIDEIQNKVRTRDGIHFEANGQKMVADLILQQLIFKG